MPMARHYTKEVKGFRSNPSQRSCLEKGHTEDICKPTLTALSCVCAYRFTNDLHDWSNTHSQALFQNLASRLAVLYAAYIGSCILKLGLCTYCADTKKTKYTLYVFMCQHSMCTARYFKPCTLCTLSSHIRLEFFCAN